MQPTGCPQPFCVLQRDGVDRDTVAELLVRLLAGDTVSRLRPPPPRDSHELCVSCVHRVMDGKGPLRWGKELEDTVAGWRSYRRQRRMRARERA